MKIITWAGLASHLTLILFFIGSVLIPKSSDAANMYKYKNEKGKWVFSDKPPKGKIPFSKKKLIITEAAQKVVVLNRGTKERPLIYAVNNLSGPVQVKVHFKKKKNIKFGNDTRLDSNNQLTWIVAGNTEKLLLQIEPRSRDKPWHYEWSSQIILGQPLKNVHSYDYGIPFTGGPFYVTQGFKGKASHSTHITNHYAVDFGLPIGTPIIAARDGVIMDTEKDFSRVGWDKTYIDEANIVRVLHDDGTMALYVHLAPDSIIVRNGQRVEKGQRLGLSGNTGFSSGPHLHFAIQMNNGDELISIPFQLDNIRQPLEPGLLIP